MVSEKKGRSAKAYKTERLRRLKCGKRWDQAGSSEHLGSSREAISRAGCKTRAGEKEKRKGVKDRGVRTRQEGFAVCKETRQISRT